MNQAAFLRILHDGLAGLPKQEIDEILNDYSDYFDEALASGRSEEEVAAALGDPRRLARELRAETGLRRWENHHSLRNSANALLALGGLAAVDILVLLPLLFAVMLVVLVASLATFVLGAIGVSMLFGALKIIFFASIARTVLRLVIAVAFIGASAGLGTLLLLGLNAAVRWLGQYARLHYRLLKPDEHAI